MSLQFESVSPRDVGPGLIAGVMAVVATFLLVPLVVGEPARTDIVRQLILRWPFAGVGERALDVVLFANAHSVPVGSGEFAWDALQYAGATRATLVPPLVLATTGVVVGRQASSLRPGLRRGVCVAVGYAPAAVAAVFVFQATSRDLTLGPALLPFAAQAAAHAVVFGGLGAVLGCAWRADATRSLSALSRRVPAATGAVAGAAAYLAGYAATYLAGSRVLAIDGSGGSLLSPFASSLPWVDGATNAAGFFFYNAHYVPLTSFADTTRGGNFLHNGYVSPLVEHLWTLHLLPAAALLAAGFVAARRSRRGTIAGAATVLGYLPLAVAGVFLFGSVAPNGSTVQPALATTVVRAGLVYPLLLGGLGGYLGDL